jgi:DNA-binding LacI/PurR family transcriptional regulator
MIKQTVFMKSKATSFDIAHRAGVSQSTVSRALSNSPLVNEETREKVQRIANELNYKVDKNASSLRTQRSKTIALLLFEDPSSDDSQINPFFISMLGAITKACSTAGYDLLVSFQNLQDDWHAEYEDSNKADGIILLGYGDYLDYQSKLEQLEKQETHFVRWGAHDPNHPGISVGCHNYQGGYLVTEHLIQRGRKRFAFIGVTDSGAPEFKARFQGMENALIQHNLIDKFIGQFDAIFTLEAGEEAMEMLLEEGILPDAIVCASDLIAIGVQRAMQAKGLSCPGDIAVVGFDNIPVSEFTNPPLTTVKQDTQKAGKVLVDKLLRLIEGETASDMLLPTEIVIRRSS